MIITRKRPNFHEIQKTIEKIEYRPDVGQARALISLAYTSRLKPGILLNLKSDQIYKDRNNIIILTNNKTIKIKTENKLSGIIWDHVKHIPPNTYIFYHFRRPRHYKKNNKTYTRYDDKYTYYLKKWFIYGFFRVKPRDFC